jgi:hypothetical protein
MLTYQGAILLTGDQVAEMSGQPTQQANPNQPNFGMEMRNVAALGGAEDVYRLVWYQNNNTSDTFFKNGQLWRLERYTGSGDPATDTGNWQNVPGYNNLTPKNDLVSGVGGGDEYIVFSQGNGSRHLLYNINGGLSQTPTNLFYAGKDQNGDPDRGNNNSELDFVDAYAAFNAVCFCKGTLIATDQGARRIEDLAIGDLVVTRDHGLQPIRWIGRSDVTLGGTIINPDLLPVRVGQGAMGAGLPKRDLWLSPQHRVLVQSPIVARMIGQDAALVAIRQLTQAAGITQTSAPRAVSYYHLRLDRHELICAEGLWAESLLVGAQALRGMGPAARRELQALFPDLVEDASDAARPIIAGRRARHLAARHVRNHKDLVQTA